MTRKWNLNKRIILWKIMKNYENKNNLWYHFPNQITKKISFYYMSWFQCSLPLIKFKSSKYVNWAIFISFQKIVYIFLYYMLKFLLFCTHLCLTQFWYKYFSMILDVWLVVIICWLIISNFLRILKQWLLNSK